MNVFCLQSSAHPEAFAVLLTKLMAEEDEDIQQSIALALQLKELFPSSSPQYDSLPSLFQAL
jgi:hypothetical protein